MEFLIGRLMEDLAINLGVRDIAVEALAEFDIDFNAVADEEPDAALGNGGLGRLAACYLESMATVGCPPTATACAMSTASLSSHLRMAVSRKTPRTGLPTVTPGTSTAPNLSTE